MLEGSGCQGEQHENKRTFATCRIATEHLYKVQINKYTQVDMAGSSRSRFSGEEVLAFLEEEEDDGDIDVFCPGSDDDLGLLEEGEGEGEEEVDNEVEKVNDLEESRLAVRQEYRCLATEHAYLDYLQ